ncbi:hypothetical protein B0J17DRAFT_632360 [Rhizoctonia solani]|nr:hypothetical protein B0J17DRAFT_632360 [Rhizoctonia solani]
MVAPDPGFVFPPTDSSIPPALAIDFHHEHNPHHVFAVLHNATNSLQTGITYAQLAYAVHHIAHILNPGNLIPQGSNIGLLVSTSTLEYVIMILGAMRAGLVPFPISPRVHPSGIAHLLTTTKTSLVIAGGSDAISNVIEQLSATLDGSCFSFKFIKLSALGDIISLAEASDARFKHFPSLEPMNNNWTVSILHSSGSTGTPKAIKYHLEGVFKNIINQPIGWTLSGPSARVGTMALPAFHCMGLILQVLAPLYMGYTQVLFAPARVPVMPNQSLTLEAIANTNCTFLICVPTFLDAWAQDENAIATLKRMKGIMFGGGPLTDIVGDKLAKHGNKPKLISSEMSANGFSWVGVRLYPLYGATEVGLVNVAPPHDQIRDWPWNCIEISPHVKPHFIPQNDQDNTFELVFENSRLTGTIPIEVGCMEIVSEILLRMAYGLQVGEFVLANRNSVGRVDDRIVLLNGEKTNPGSWAEIAKCPLVHSAIMFGQARNQTGVVIELQETSGLLSEKNNSRRELMGILRPYIQRANQTCATHSRLDERAVVFVDPARPLPRTPKGTVPRSAALKLYAREIEEMYAALEQDLDKDISDNVQPPETWSSPDTVSMWIAERVRGFLGRNVDPTVDLFQQGMDSLIATMLLRTLKTAMHASQDPNIQSCARTLTQTVVFDNPTVRQLASFVVQCITNPSVFDDRTQTTLKNINLMIQKYDSRWSQVPRFLWGACGGNWDDWRTGASLGTNRKSSEDSRNRQRASFKDKMLDRGLLASKKLILVDVILEDTNLGLNQDRYDENAWEVNFNLALQSFEPNIRGTRNLLDLAFSSTAPTGLPRFAFTSSISVAGFTQLGRKLEEVSVQPEDAVSPLATRVGSTSWAADIHRSPRGSWNTTDWVPSIIASSISVGCLPAAAGIYGVDCVMASAGRRSLLDHRHLYYPRHQIPPVIHTSHPRPVPWADVMSAFSDVLASRTGSALPIVEFGEWNKRVTESAVAFQGSDADRYKRFPSTKIQGTMDGMAYADQVLRAGDGDEGAESGGTVRLVTTRAEQASEGLRNTPRLGRGHVEKWVKYWEAKGIFS